ncbi:MAG: hypothetical protein ABIF04_08035 [Chloroflexota bacterium]
MNDTDLMPEPSSAVKHSRLGIASFISAILAVTIILGDITGIAFFRDKATVLNGLNTMDSVLTCFTALLTLVGVGLGLIAVARKEPKRVFGVLGVVFNGLFLLTILILYFINIFTMMRTSGT